MLRATTERLFGSRPQQPKTYHNGLTLRRSVTEPPQLTTPIDAKVRDGDFSPPARAGTSLPTLPTPSKPQILASIRDVRDAIGNAQLQRARLAADHGKSFTAALVELAPEALVAGGVVANATKATTLLSTLHDYFVTDAQNRITRKVDTWAVDQAARKASLSAPERSRALTAVKIARFLLEYGIREVPFSFDAELACGNAFLAKQGTEGNFESFLKALFDPSDSDGRNAHLQSALIDLR